METMDILVARYKLCMEELTDAQKYLRLAKECGEQEGRDMFLSLAGQELGHYDTLCRSGEKILDRNHGTEEQRTVWSALMSTSGDWATELREKIDRVRHTN